LAAWRFNSSGTRPADPNLLEHALLIESNLLSSDPISASLRLCVQILWHTSCWSNPSGTRPADRIQPSLFRSDLCVSASLRLCVQILWNTSCWSNPSGTRPADRIQPSLFRSDLCVSASLRSTPLKHALPYPIPIPISSS